MSEAVPMDVDKPNIIAFHNQHYYYAAFTQCYKCSAGIFMYGKIFSYAQAAMMYAKADLFPGNEDIKEKILASNDPADLKRLGRMVRNFNQSIWDVKKFDIVVAINLAKFKNNPKLLLCLLNTDDSILVEASPHDNIWGAGISHTHPDITNPDKWPGQNLLGKALMKTRDIIRYGTKYP